MKSNALLTIYCNLCTTLTFQTFIVNIYLICTENSAASFANIAMKIILNTIKFSHARLSNKHHEHETYTSPDYNYSN